MLSAIGGERKGFRGSAYQSIPQNPVALGGRVLFLGHGSSLPREQRKQRLGWDQSPSANADSAQATRRHVVVERGAAPASRLAGFLDGIAELRGIVLFGLHWLASFLGGCR